MHALEIFSELVKVELLDFRLSAQVCRLSCLIAYLAFVLRSSISGIGGRAAQGKMGQREARQGEEKQGRLGERLCRPK